MITKLSVSNFKSIRHLDIDCKKVNLFIGEPNTGKSNILESLGLLSWCGQEGRKTLGDYVRFGKLMQYLFYDSLIDRSIKIKLSTKEIDPTGIRIVLSGNQYEIFKWESNNPIWTLDKYGQYDGSQSFGQTRFIKFFRFKNIEEYGSDDPGCLIPPNGENLISVISGSENLRKIMKEFFEKYGLIVRIKRHPEKVIEIE